MRFRKTYVDVVARIDVDGRITPLSIRWRDGRTFEIDRVEEAIRRASTRVGGTGVRYLVQVNGREKFLFYEGPRWFVEEVVPEADDGAGSASHAGGPNMPGQRGAQAPSSRAAGTGRAPKAYRAPLPASPASKTASFPPADRPSDGAARRAFARLARALTPRSRRPLPGSRAPRA